MENQMTFSPFLMARRWMAILGAILAMGTVTSADAGLFGLGGTSWKEEVLLHDGSAMVVDRSQSRGGRHEIGQSPPVKEHSITFTMPGTNTSITWKDEFSEDVGSSNLSLLALQILHGAPYIVASPYGCLAYNKWGRPDPPYVIFRYKDKKWERISIQELPGEFKNINLVVDTANNEGKLRALGLVTSERINEFNKWYRQIEYKTVVREPMISGEGSLINCEKLVFYKGAWVGPGDSIGKRMRDIETRQP
jgi:hypothetical protein